MSKIITFAKLGQHVAGRWANQMFSIAGTIGIARKNGFDFAFPEWKNHEGRTFDPSIDIECQKEFVNPLPRYEGPELPEISIPWGYHDIKLTESVSILGHMQSEKYFEHAIDEVRWYLTMKDEGPSEDYVAVHWRAGDYGPESSPQHPDGNSYHPRMNMRYYGPAMALFHEAKFLIFSDDMPGARRMFGDSVDYSEEGYFDDFRRMKRCRHFIIANSSYSLMSAILGDAPDKKVVAPYPWFGGPWRTMDMKDIYSPGWTLVNWESSEIKQAA
jgi:hypothetical protein